VVLTVLGIQDQIRIKIEFKVKKIGLRAITSLYIVKWVPKGKAMFTPMTI